MSYLTNENTETIKTAATLDALEKVLIDEDFKVTRAKFTISAIKKKFWSSRSYYVNFTDLGDYRAGECREVGQGLLVFPKGGVLAEIVSIAENV